MIPGGYRERLRCPWSWYVIGSIAAVLIALEVAIVIPTVPLWLVGVLTVVGAVIVVAWIGRKTISVADGTLRVHGATLDVSYVAAVAPLDARTMQRLLGRDGDPAAFLATKPWVGPGVQILLDDPEDPVPYWAVSTRNPHELAEALTARATMPPPPPAQRPARRDHALPTDRLPDAGEPA